MPCGYFARDLIHYVGRSGLFLAFGIVLTVLRSCVGTRSCVAQKLQCTVHWTWVQHLADPFIWSGGMDRMGRCPEGRLGEASRHSARKA